MFSPDVIIDSVQNAKKHVVNTFVVDKTIKTSFIEVIDAQTAFIKSASQNALTLSQMVVKNFAVSSTK
jgi:hypothetical protein